NFRSECASILRNTSSAGAITSGPMPSPPRTAMWRAVLADIGIPLGDECRGLVVRDARGCRAPHHEEVDLILRSALMCASRRMKAPRLRRQDRAANQLALLQI